MGGHSLNRLDCSRSRYSSVFHQIEVSIQIFKYHSDSQELPAHAAVVSSTAREWSGGFGSKMPNQWPFF